MPDDDSLSSALLFLYVCCAIALAVNIDWYHVMQLAVWLAHNPPVIPDGSVG